MINQPHYASVVQTLIRLYNAGRLPHAQAIDVEPNYGFTATIHYQNGSRRYINGAAIDLNTSGAVRIAKDKGEAKRIMQQLGYQTPHGKTFLTPKRMGEIQQLIQRFGIQEGNTIAAIPEYINDHIDYPCFVKPNDGYRGQNVHKCHNLDDLTAALEQLVAAHLDLILVEVAITLPEYRIVVFEGNVFACYSKSPLTIYGDGSATIQTLIDRHYDRLLSQGRKINLEIVRPQIQRRLDNLNLTPDSVLLAGKTLQLVDVGNLTTGGMMIDNIQNLHDHWRELCVQLSHDLNLRLVGIDFLCGDIADPNSEYSILEVNAAPSLNNYAALGASQANAVEDLYAQVFNTPTC